MLSLLIFVFFKRLNYGTSVGFISPHRSQTVGQRNQRTRQNKRWIVSFLQCCTVALRLSLSLHSRTRCTRSLDSQKESSSPVSQLRKLGNQLSLHDPIRNVPWTEDERQSLNHPSESPICPLRRALNKASASNTSSYAPEIACLIFSKYYTDPGDQPITIALMCVTKTPKTDAR